MNIVEKEACFTQVDIRKVQDDIEKAINWRVLDWEVS